MFLLFQGGIFRFHVSFRGCIHNFDFSHTNKKEQNLKNLKGSEDISIFNYHKLPLMKCLCGRHSLPGVIKSPILGGSNNTNLW